MGRDTRVPVGESETDSFNPRARMGRDIINKQGVGRSGVSIHAPAWGATFSRYLSSIRSRVFQSTRPHGARQRVFYSRHFGKVVSIHAPAWGATFRPRPSHNSPRVSIHAPAWGATWSELFGIPHCLFQSTRPHGARLFSTSSPSDFSIVSIHAPAWGATARKNYYRRQSFVSIHAPAWGAT